MVKQETLCHHLQLVENQKCSLCLIPVVHCRYLNIIKTTDTARVSQWNYYSDYFQTK